MQAPADILDAARGWHAIKFGEPFPPDMIRFTGRIGAQVLLTETKQAAFRGGYPESVILSECETEGPAVKAGGVAVQKDPLVAGADGEAGFFSGQRGCEAKPPAGSIGSERQGHGVELIHRIGQVFFPPLVPLKVEDDAVRGEVNASLGVFGAIEHGAVPKRGRYVMLAERAVVLAP